MTIPDVHITGDAKPPVVSIGPVTIVGEWNHPVTVVGDKNGQARMKAYVAANENWVQSLVDPYGHIPVLPPGASPDNLRKLANLELEAAARAQRGAKTFYPSVPDENDAGKWAAKQSWKAFVRGATDYATRDLARSPVQLRGFEAAADAEMGLDYHRRAADLEAAAAKNFDRANAIEDRADGL